MSSHYDLFHNDWFTANIQFLLDNIGVLQLPEHRNFSQSCARDTFILDFKANFLQSKYDGSCH